MKAKKKFTLAKDPAKESHFRELAATFKNAGYTVRREKLKAGPGWKVVSGSCRANDQKLIFVDPRLSQDDQILFLKARASSSGVAIVSSEENVHAESAA